MATELSTMRLGLHLLRATLLNFGVDRAAPELLTYDAHARWILARTGDAMSALRDHLHARAANDTRRASNTNDCNASRSR